MIQTVVHTLPPVFNEQSRILILGTMPSPKSREAGFYYGHPRNRFWPVLAAVLGEASPGTTDEKRSLVLRHHIAVWDVLYRCEIDGADDSTIRNPVPNDMNLIISQAPIRAVYTTGTRAYELYQRYCYPVTKLAAIRLPSTSPANCRMSFDALKLSYAAILESLFL